MSEEARMAAVDAPIIAQQAARIAELEGTITDVMASSLSLVAELEHELTAARVVIGTVEEVLAREVSMSALRIAIAQYHEKQKGTTPMSEQSPSVARMVHFVYGDTHVPAIITDPAFVVHETGQPDWTGQALTVFPVGEAPFTTVALLDAGGAAATWHWPERV